MRRLQSNRRSNTPAPAPRVGRVLAPDALSDVKGGAGDNIEARNSAVDDWQLLQS